VKQCEAFTPPLIHISRCRTFGYRPLLSRESSNHHLGSGPNAFTILPEFCLPTDFDKFSRDYDVSMEDNIGDIRAESVDAKTPETRTHSRRALDPEMNILISILVKSRLQRV
jgi:hypothetical protein